MPGLPSNPVTPSAMPTRNLGKTGYRVGLFSLGGQAALEKPNNFDVAVPIIERALDLGVNYIDTSSIYGGPERWSEQYVGKVMAHRREQAFLATKTKERTRDDSMRMIEKSLQLLQTDHVDLWQLHDVGTMTDVNAIFAKGGAMEALVEMKEQKVVRCLGLTGHYRPDALMETMRRYPSFDTILMAMNAADPHYFSFNDALLPMAVERQMGIIGMKVPGRSPASCQSSPPSPSGSDRAGPSAMILLHDRVEAAWPQLGYREEHRRFQPHLTIGRVRGTGPGIAELGCLVQQHADFSGGRMTIAKVSLFASTLTPDGPIYKLLGTGRLGG